MSPVLSDVECRNLWKRCMNAEYLNSIQARGSDRCRFCAYTRECNNHFCLLCMEGGLCPMQFRDRNAHAHHPWLQVRSATNQTVINAREVEHFLGENARKIQKYVDNRSEFYNLKTKVWTTREGKTIIQPNDVVCGGCDSSISKATTTTTVGVEVCSIECLIKFADRKKQLKYLVLRDGVDLREPYVFPMTTSEKRVYEYECRVPVPLRLFYAPAPRHNANDSGDDVKMETTDSGVVAMEIDENVAVESEVVCD